MSKTTKQDMVLEALQSGERLTSADIKSNFGVANNVSKFKIVSACELADSLSPLEKKVLSQRFILWVQKHLEKLLPLVTEL